VTRALAKLHLVTGKGGVGKSSFAAALALKAAQRRKRVLAIELGEPSGLAGLLGVRPKQHGVPEQVQRGLFLAYFNGEAALGEYLLRHLPFLRERMRAVFEHPLYRAFVGSGPGVGELMVIGKVRDELLGLSTGKPQWDALVVDAGASGHALQMFGMPAATANTFSAGLAHRESRRVAATLADPERTAVHVVALPELMPLVEAAETVERLRVLGLPVGRLVVNQCRPPAPGGTEAALARLTEDPSDPNRKCLARVAGRALAWARAQEEGIATLEQRVALTAERLPRLVTTRFGLAQVEALAVSLAVEPGL
jgi:anion-transporting  ArsA/GET3 family ATPase